MFSLESFVLGMLTVLIVWALIDILHEIFIIRRK